MIVIMTEVCEKCPIDQFCCYSPLVPLTDEEQLKLKRESIMIVERWCDYFNLETRKCNLGDDRPLACKMHVCRWINEKLPIRNRVML